MTWIITFADGEWTRVRAGNPIAALEAIEHRSLADIVKVERLDDK